ncbi:sugar O-acetyltransferase [Vibrio sp. S17_S38]|uniref:sugar O-acetyltransferase n=1 Tax=Vibrio sp. S17_S38 TaxID=2720229 RepID=UPI0016811F46|nr:sugar O-acetyltransferase [Vibrio sp. S17_S38]MBD1574745.1 sugar O-acetyltransferase [Vibrio sp. S17_S38]
MEELEKMVSGLPYNPSDHKLVILNEKAGRLASEYNHYYYNDRVKSDEILTSLLGSIGDNVVIRPDFRCDYGLNIRVGNNFFANFGCVILDCAEVTFGDNCMLGPHVGIYTATHPIDPVERCSGIEFAEAVTIGNNCWIGGHAVINPGVTLGDNVVVASGSVVTKSFGSNVVIGGVPAKVLKVVIPS